MQIPEFIEIRNAAGQRRALLSPQADGLKDCWIDQRLNADCVRRWAFRRSKISFWGVAR